MPNLFGRVPFGRVSNDPRMILTQLLYLTSLFFILLGTSITALELWSSFISLGDPTVQTSSISKTSASTTQKMSAAAESETARNFKRNDAFSIAEMSEVNRERDGGGGSSGDLSEEQRERRRRRRGSTVGSKRDKTTVNLSGELDDGEGKGEASVVVEAEKKRHGINTSGSSAASIGDISKKEAADDKDEASISFEFGTYSPKRPQNNSPNTRDPNKKYLHGGFYISVESLFVATEIGESTTALSAITKFVLAHIFTAVLLCYPAAVCIERRKFVTDFIVTVYVVYYVCTVLSTHSLFQPFSYWVALVSALVTCMVGTVQIAYRREMAEVLISAEDQPIQMTTIGGSQGGGSGPSPNTNN